MSKNGLFFYKFIEFVWQLFLPPASNMPSSEEQDALFAEFKANIDKHLDDTVRTLTSMAPKAAVNEVDETIQGFRNWEPQLGYSRVLTLILNYLDKLRVALDDIEPSDGDYTLLNYVMSECSSAHQDARFDY